MLSNFISQDYQHKSPDVEYKNVWEVNLKNNSSVLCADVAQKYRTDIDTAVRDSFIY